LSSHKDPIAISSGCDRQEKAREVGGGLAHLFMPIFGGLKNLPLATVDILIVLGTIVWMIVVIWPQHRWVAVAQVPYLVWVSIATVLQVAITRRNW
jgi:tryptophan-rich sensory protein